MNLLLSLVPLGSMGVCLSIEEYKFLWVVKLASKSSWTCRKILS